MIRSFIQNHIGVFLIITIGLVALVPMLGEGFPLTHDGKDHIARIANFYLALSDGQIVPRWGANLNWGFGHPVLMFLYPLPSYFASFFHVLGFSLTDSTKLVFSIAYIASGLSMYLWVRRITNEFAGIIAGLLYMLAPYRLVDLYVRGAIGEHVAFIFPPLILYFLLRLSVQKKISFRIGETVQNVVGASGSTALLILSHNAISLMFLPIIFLYILFLFYTAFPKKIFLAFSGFSVLYGFLLASFFWVPAFFEGKYTLRDIVTGSEAMSRFIDPSRLIYSNWNFGISGQFSIQIGLLHMLFVILGFFVGYKLLKKGKKNFALLLFGAEALFFGSIFIMTEYSSFLWQVFTILQKFQFPWRFLTLIVFFSSLIGGICLYYFNKKILLLASVIFLLFVSLPYIKVKGYLNNDDIFYKDTYHGTTDTGESSPIWSVRFMENEANAPLEVLEGEVLIEEVSRNSVEHRYVVVSTNGQARLKDNTLYFPGWRVYLNGEQQDIQFQDGNHRGVITFMVPEGVSEVSVEFGETKLRLLSNTITIVSVAGIIAIWLLVFFGKQNIKVTKVKKRRKTN